MKRILIFISTIIFAGLLSACNKNDQPSLGSPATQTINYNNTSLVNYRLNTLQPGSRSIFHWSDGYINVTQLRFNDFHPLGDAYTDQIFGNQVQQMASISDQALLGYVPIPAIKCDAATFALVLGSPGLLKTTARSSIAAPYHALYLNGSYNSAIDMPPARGIPVQVVIDDSVQINTQYLYNLSIVKTSYTASIQFSLDQLGNGITANMMNNAIITNGTIYITSANNQNLYEMIVHNLQDNMMQVQLTTQLIGTASAPVQ